MREMAFDRAGRKALALTTRIVASCEERTREGSAENLPRTKGTPSTKPDAIPRTAVMEAASPGLWILEMREHDIPKNASSSASVRPEIGGASCSSLRFCRTIPTSVYRAPLGRASVTRAMGVEPQRTRARPPVGERARACYDETDDTFYVRRGEEVGLIGLRRPFRRGSRLRPPTTCSFPPTGS